MSTAVNNDEAKLIELRYGLADLISLCESLSAETISEAIGLTGLLRAADMQVALLLHLKEVQTATRRVSKLLVAAA